MMINEKNEYEIVINPYNRKNSKNRKGLMALGDWRNEFTSLISQYKIKALYFNSARGCRIKNFEFLSNLPEIEEIDITIGETEALESLEMIKNINEIYLSTNSKSSINFIYFQNLEKLYISYWSKLKNIDKCPNLKELHVDRPNESFLGSLEKMNSLEELTIGNSSIKNLNLVEKLQNLTKLELINCKNLEKYDFIGNLQKLKWLNINSSKGMKNLNFMKNLKNLEVLILTDVNEIEDINVVCSLKSLKAFWFAGNTNILNGDLSCLELLPNLSMVNFNERKHYTHKIIKKWSWDNFETPDKLLEIK